MVVENDRLLNMAEDLPLSKAFSVIDNSVVKIIDSFCSQVSMSFMSALTEEVIQYMQGSEEKVPVRHEEYLMPETGHGQQGTGRHEHAPQRRARAADAVERRPGFQTLLVLADEHRRTFPLNHFLKKFQGLILLSVPYPTVLVGLVINPVAGMGGSVALKGTDGAAYQEALSLGATAIAPSTGQARSGQDIRRCRISDRLGRHGQGALADLGFSFEVVYSLEETAVPRIPVGGVRGAP